MSVIKRFGDYFRNRSTTFRPSDTIGEPGTAIFGGYPQEIELDIELTDRDRYRLFSEALINTAIVGTGVRYFLSLVGSAEWTVEPSEADTTGEWAKMAEEMLFEDPKTSWSKIIKQLAGYRFYGFAVMEWIAKKHPDGHITIADIKQRPQITIERWDRVEGEIIGVSQRVPQSSEERYLPRGKIAYIVDDILNDSPRGLGLFRHVVDSVSRLKEYEKLEAVGFFTDLRGVPVGRAPYAEMAKAVKRGDMTAEEMKKAVNAIRAFMQKHIRSTSTGVLLDSQVHQTEDGTGRPSNVYKFDLKLLEGSQTSLTEIASAIERINLELARLLGVEVIILGNGEGSYALADQKDNRLAMVVSDTLDETGHTIENDVLKPTWNINGWPPEYMPSLKASASKFFNPEEITSALRDLSMSGLEPDDPADDFVREKMGIPLKDRDGMEIDAMGRGGEMDENKMPEEDEE